MASIAVLPVLIGLAVDYAIQLQARVQEAQAAGEGIEAAVAAHGRARRPDGGHRRGGHRGGLPRARALAGADGARLRAAAGGGHRARAGLRADARAWPRSPARRGARRRAAPALAGARRPAWRGAGELLVGQPRGARACAAAAPRAGRGALRLATAHPGRVVARRARGRRRRLGPRDADAGRVRPDQARAPERGDPRPAGAAALDRRRRRDRRRRLGRAASPTRPSSSG